VDRVVQERLLEAKAMDRKNTPGAVMHQFSLWSKAAGNAPTGSAAGAGGIPAPAAALRSQSDPVAAVSMVYAAPQLGASLGSVHTGANSGEPIRAAPATKLSAITQNRNSALASTPGAAEAAESAPSSAARRGSKLRGPKAVREQHLASEEDHNNAADASNSPLNVSFEDRNTSQVGSHDVLDEDYTMEFEPIGGIAEGERPVAQSTVDGVGHSSGLATALRRKVGGAKLASSEHGSPEVKQGDTPNHMFITPEKKTTSAKATPLTATTVHSVPSTGDQEGSDSGGWHSDIDEDDEAQRLSLGGAGRPRSAEPSGIGGAEAAAIKSMSQSGPAAFAAMKVSASMDVSQGKLETGFASTGNLVEAANADHTAPLAMRRATTSGDNRHFVDRLEHLVSAAGTSETNGQLLKSMTSRSASECNITFDATAGHSSVKVGSSKYQTLRNLRSVKGSTHFSSSEKVAPPLAMESGKAAMDSDRQADPQIAHNPYSTAGVNSNSRSSTLNANLPLTALIAPPAIAVDDDAAAMLSARSRDDASPTLSEASAEEPEELQNRRSPLRVDLDNPRERNGSEQQLSGQVIDEDHEDSPLRWRKGEVIGEGTFGKVYKGMNEKTGELLAIKQLCLIDGTSNEVESLRKEISVMWDLEHENIVRYMRSRVANALDARNLQSFFRPCATGTWVHPSRSGTCSSSWSTSREAPSPA
jgi:hypothetical protein